MEAGQGPRYMWAGRRAGRASLPPTLAWAASYRGQLH